jgi:glycosyltransferase involved in cell wall biosynthesis
MLADRGHDVRVLVDQRGVYGDIDGLHVIARPALRTMIDEYRWCDVVFTQTASRTRALRLATFSHRPIVQFIRGTNWIVPSRWGAPDLAVFNADWLRERQPWPGATTVVHPPIPIDRYRTDAGDRVTLVNLSIAKGSRTFFELAQRLPGWKFLGVRGGYAEQAIPANVPPNVEIAATVDDMRSVFQRTQILLLPSSEEAYGRVAVEAACSGIPTIASPLEGIREALGDAALYAAPSDVHAWIAHLDRLADEGYYRLRSQAALKRAAIVADATLGEIRNLEEQLCELLAKRAGRRSTASLGQS